MFFLPVLSDDNVTNSGSELRAIELLVGSIVILSQNAFFETFDYQFLDLATVSTPEPSTMLLLGSGLAGLGFLRRSKKTF